MKAWVVPRYKQPIELTDLPEPSAGDHDVSPRSDPGWRGSRSATRSTAVIDRTFPFDRTPDALSYVQAGRSKGKVVITLEETS